MDLVRRGQLVLDGLARVEAEAGAADVVAVIGSHHRGARGAAVGLNSSRLVISHASRTDRQNNPSLNACPRSSSVPPCRPLFNPDSTRSYQSNYAQLSFLQRRPPQQSTHEFSSSLT